MKHWSFCNKKTDYLNFSNVIFMNMSTHLASSSFSSKECEGVIFPKITVLKSYKCVTSIFSLYTVMKFVFSSSTSTWLKSWKCAANILSLNLLVAWVLFQILILEALKMHYWYAVIHFTCCWSNIKKMVIKSEKNSDTNIFLFYA